MKDFKWDKTDFIEFFEVLPKTDDYETEHVFEIVKNNLKFRLTLWQFESAVQLDLFSSNIDTPNISLTLYVRGVSEISDYKGREYLRFRNSIVVPNRFFYNKDYDVDFFDTDTVTFGYTVSVAVNPDIKICLETEIV